MASPITTVRAELAAITALASLMQEEQQCLVAADTDGLNLITPQKAQLVSQLGALAQERHRHLAAAGFAAQEASMEAWLVAVKDSAALAEWQALLSKTREAKELNRVNGMLINKQMMHNQHLINAMRTPSSAADAAVYGPSGQTTPGGPSRRYVIG